MTDQDIVLIAEMCHEMNRLYCSKIGDDSQPLWESAPDWQKQSAIDGVKAVLAHPNPTGRASHENWLKHKAANGWVYGPKKDAQLKTHPCMVPYDELPEEQREKDEIFIATVRFMRHAIQQTSFDWAQFILRSLY